MRFYFDIRDKLAIRDEVGRDLRSVSEAVVYAKYLAADFRCLEPDARPTTIHSGNWRRQQRESTRKSSSLRPLRPEARKFARRL